MKNKNQLKKVILVMSSLGMCSMAFATTSSKPHFSPKDAARINLQWFSGTCATVSGGGTINPGNVQTVHQDAPVSYCIKVVNPSTNKLPVLANAASIQLTARGAEAANLGIVTSQAGASTKTCSFYNDPAHVSCDVLISANSASGSNIIVGANQNGSQTGVNLPNLNFTVAGKVDVKVDVNGHSLGLLKVNMLTKNHFDARALQLSGSTNSGHFVFTLQNNGKQFVQLLDAKGNVQSKIECSASAVSGGSCGIFVEPMDTNPGIGQTATITAAWEDTILGGDDQHNIPINNQNFPLQVTVGTLFASTSEKSLMDYNNSVATANPIAALAATYVNKDVASLYAGTSTIGFNSADDFLGAPMHASFDDVFTGQMVQLKTGLPNLRSIALANGGQGGLAFAGQMGTAYTTTGNVADAKNITPALSSANLGSFQMLDAAFNQNNGFLSLEHGSGEIYGITTSGQFKPVIASVPSAASYQLTNLITWGTSGVIGVFSNVQGTASIQSQYLAVPTRSDLSQWSPITLPTAIATALGTDFNVEAYSIDTNGLNTSVVMVVQASDNKTNYLLQAAYDNTGAVSIRNVFKNSSINAMNLGDLSNSHIQDVAFDSYTGNIFFITNEAGASRLWDVKVTRSFGTRALTLETNNLPGTGNGPVTELNSTTSGTYTLKTGDKFGVMTIFDNWNMTD